MGDPRTFWLNVANALLALVVLACIAAVVICIVHEILARLRKYHAVSKELNGDMERWFGSGRHRHVLHRRR